MQTYFSRFFIFFMAIFLLFSGREEKVQMTATLDAEGGSIEYVIVNYSAFPVNADEYYSLEKNTDGRWAEYPLETAVPDIGLVIRPFSEYKGVIRPDTALEAGEYRLSKTVLPAGGIRTVTAVFSVG